MPTTPSALFEDDELADDVEAALGGSTELHDLRTAAKVLRSHPDRLLAKLRLIREDPDLLEALAERSYRHQNGFTKVKLVAKDRFSVRLHLWPPSAATRGDVNPHGHQWRFASWVVCGGGLNEQFYRQSHESDAAARRYDKYWFGASRDGAWSVDVSEPAWLTATRSHDRPEGTVYTCSPFTVHTVIPRGDGFVATVVVQGPNLLPFVPVYVSGERSPMAYERRVSADELAADLITLERALEQ